MRITPTKLPFGSNNYKCTNCNHKFSLMDLLSNKPHKGERHYCPKCKVKFIL